MARRYLLPSWLADHWQLKLLSLGFAILLWLFVEGQEKMEMVMSVPVEFSRLPQGLEVAGDSDSVDVRIQGLRGVVTRLGHRDLRVTVNLAEARAGEMTVRLTPAEVSAPRGVQVLRVFPSRLRLLLQPSSVSQTPAARETTGGLTPREFR